MIERLKGLGINGNFLKNIEAMYKLTSYSIKLKEVFLDPISSNLGLKQGCPLSPKLFNLYIDDIKDNFDELCDPVALAETKITHFLYADDLVLISYTKTGLQRCLDRVYEFSSQKYLTVSTKKSKTMILLIL